MVFLVDQQNRSGLGTQSDQRTLGIFLEVMGDKMHFEEQFASHRSDGVGRVHSPMRKLLCQSGPDSLLHYLVGLGGGA